MNQPIPEELKRKRALAKLRVVFAESCTAGLVAAQLASVPGISEFLCGSMVTYRESAKSEWLDVPANMLEEHTAVSAPVTVAMAEGALKRTREADLAIAVTGHLGPNAPEKLDGVVFIAGVLRGRSEASPRVEQYRLTSTDRVDRQHEAVSQVLQFGCDMLVKI